MIGSFFFSRKEYAVNLESLDGNITVQVLINANDILPIFLSLHFGEHFAHVNVWAIGK